jgi:hypothetical protein
MTRLNKLVLFKLNDKKINKDIMYQKKNDHYNLE